MSFKSILAKPFAKWAVSRNNFWIKNPVETQEKVLKTLVQTAQHTQFGKDHQFDKISTYEDFKKYVPVVDYEGLKDYVELIKEGKSDVLWKGKPAYFAKTSGTTSGTKYIPISKESIPYHIKSARDALLNYIFETGNSDFVNGKMIFLQGSPILDNSYNIPTGRLSGIVAHHVPAYLQKNRMPSFETNCIEDWETKVDKIIDETLLEDMTLISGIPPWVQMYFDKLQLRTGKKIKDIFPQFSLFVYGGVNFEPYKAKIFESIGKEIPSIETYPASEGFIAYQNSQKDDALLLLTDNGMFYEFIRADEFFSENPKRISIKDVELNVNYVLILNTNAGLWGYNIGDTIKFVSLYPHKIKVAGRIHHFISAFGEHVIGSEVENALKYAMQNHPETEVVEFTVAPHVNPKNELPYHEWFIAFAQQPKDLNAFALDIDKRLREQNPYYDDLLKCNLLRPLKINALPADAFIKYMKSKGKLGGQNKVPRLSNDRKIAEELMAF